MGSHAHEADGKAAVLPVDVAGEIRSFAKRLPQMSYYDVLGVEPEVDEEAVRKAFFERSKRFHPDRYFSYDLGSYRELLTEVYKRVVVAHEVLRDAKLRAEYDRRLAADRAAAPPKPAGPSLRNRRGLRARTSALKHLEAQLDRGRRKARGHFNEALAQRDAGDWVKAVDLLHLAMVIDPREAEYQEVLGELLPRASAERVQRLCDAAQSQLARGRRREALPLLEEAFALRPTDAELAIRLAELAWSEQDDLPRAREFAEQAVELAGDQASYRKTLASIYKVLGMVDEARREFQRAWELDPLDKEITAELAAL